MAAGVTVNSNYSNHCLVVDTQYCTLIQNYAVIVKTFKKRMNFNCRWQFSISNVRTFILWLVVILKVYLLFIYLFIMINLNHKININDNNYEIVLNGQ